MKTFQDKIILIKTKINIDDTGENQEIEISRKEIFAQINSVNANDYYSATQNNMKLINKVIIRKYLYDNEKYVICKTGFAKNKKLLIQRIYDTNDDFLELNLIENIGIKNE